jgi:hypothetical protein
MEPLVKIAAIKYLRRKRKEAAVKYLIKHAWKGAVLGLGALGGATYLGGKLIGTAKHMANVQSMAPSITRMNRMRFGSYARPPRIPRM